VFQTAQARTGSPSARTPALAGTSKSTRSAKRSQRQVTQCYLCPVSACASSAVL
jgi:hypothetical protein